MFDRILQLFTKRKLSNDAREFITKLADTNIWILGVGLRGVPAITGLTDQAALEVIAANRIDVAEIGDDDSVFPHNYLWNGRQTLPFFTTEERTKQFVTTLGLPTDIELYQPYEVRAGFVSVPENDSLELLLDPGFPDERLLSREERLLLRSLSTPG